MTGPTGATGPIGVTGPTGDNPVDAVVFDPDPPGTPTTAIRSNRAAIQSVNSPDGATGTTNLGSDTSGTSRGANDIYASVIGGDQGEASAPYATAVGGLGAKAFADSSLAIGGRTATASGHDSVGIGTSSIAPGTFAAAVIAAQAYGSGSVATTGGVAAGTRSIGITGLAGKVFAFTVVANTVSITIPGVDATPFIGNGDTLRIQPTTPAETASVSRTVATPPIFGGVDTTFDINLAIDTTTTAGNLADNTSAEGAIAIGDGASAPLAVAIAIGGGGVVGAPVQALAVASTAIGPALTIAASSGAVAIGESAEAGGQNSVAIGSPAVSAPGDTTTALGGSSFAGSGGQAGGDGAVAIGPNTSAGRVFAFTIGAGLVTVSIAGDVTPFINNGDPLSMLPNAPAFAPAVSRNVATVPVFGGVNTTFDINTAIDATTTAGVLSDTNDGTNSVSIGGFGNAPVDGAQGWVVGGRGNVVTSTAPNGHASGHLARASQPDQEAYASGSDSVTAGLFQTSKLVLSGATPGAAPGETVNLMTEAASFNFQSIASEQGKAYTLKLSAIANGKIAAVRTIQSFEIEVSAVNDGGVTIRAVTKTLQQGDPGGATWDITVSTDGVNIFFTFSTGATTANVAVAGRLDFTEAFLA